MGVQVQRSRRGWFGAVALWTLAATGCNVTVERGPFTDFFIKDYDLPDYDRGFALYGADRQRLGPDSASAALGGLAGAMSGGNRRAWRASVVGTVDGLAGAALGHVLSKAEQDEPLPEGYRGLVLALPIVATDPNKGPTFGLLPAAIFQEGERITNIYAPDLTWNAIDGAGGSFRMRRFFSSDATLVTDAAFSSEGAYDCETIFTQRRLGPRDDLTFQGRFWYLTSLANRFYGVGNDTEEDAESSYVFRRTMALASLTLDLPLRFAVQAQERIVSYQVGPGRLEDVPSSRATFPDVTGMKDRLTILAHRIRLTFDTRDSPSTPTEGIFGEFVYEVSDDALGSEVGFQRFSFGVTFLLPKLEKRMITVVRLAGWIVDADDQESIPFYERTALGGKNTMRGYGDGRFVDDNGFVLNLEERIAVLDYRLMEVRQVLELALFVDIGRVFAEGERFTLNDAKLTVGGAVRLVIPESELVTSIDIGISDEGPAVFVGLDYPF